MDPLKELEEALQQLNEVAASLPDVAPAPEPAPADTEEPHEHDHEEACHCHEHEHHHEEECHCYEHEHHHEEECLCHEHEHHHEEECHCHEHEHHHHEHGEECTCGCHDYDHHEHEHHHHHEHGEECSCGCHDHDHHEHEHHHHHEHGEECSCGCHDHDHHHDHAPAPARELDVGAKGKRIIYQMQNLSCAHCAAKMEEKIQQIDGVNDAVIVFATKQLRVATEHPELVIDAIRAACTSIEPDVRVLDPNDQREILQPEDHKKDLYAILGGAALLIAGLALGASGLPPILSILVLLLSYVVLGGDVLLTAGKNILNGHVFDENFLMSIATLGAVAMGEYTEAVGVMLFYRVGEYFEHVAVERSRKQIMDAIDMRPEVVQLVTDTTISTVPAADVKPGDIVLVRPGDRIPLDGVVALGESQIDTSPITGEPVPAAVQAGDAVTSGCINLVGSIHVRVTHELSESMVSRILDAVENAAASKPQAERFVTRFAKIYTPIVCLIALLTAILPPLIFDAGWKDSIYTALTFLVISCPCALVLSVPLAFFSGIGAGSKLGILFKGGSALEALNACKAVILDKTGTLTQGNFVLQQIAPVSGLTEDDLLTMAASCEQQSTHPIARSILAAAEERGLSLTQPDRIDEIAGQGVRVQLQETVLLVGSRMLLAENKVDLSMANREGIPGTEVLVAAGGRYVGRLVIADTIKENAKTSIRQLKKFGLTTAMLTGDRSSTAHQVALLLGIDEVRGRLLPQDKLTAMQELRSKYGAVMYVGDGINDAPVLAGADVGAAMGSGSDAAIEAADVVFMTSDTEAIAQSVRIARDACKIAWQNVVFALAVKFIVMLLGVAQIYSSMWLAVFADTGVAMLCVLNSIRVLYKKHDK